MKRFFRCVALLGALALLMLCCAGCTGTAERRQAKQGKALMEAWLSTRDGKKFSVDNAYTERERTAPDRIDMTEFVHGDYRVDGQKYEYWINVETGAVFTSERLAEFKAACYDLMLRELGVNSAQCVGTCVTEFIDAPRDTVMPAEIADPAGYARSHLHSDEFVVSLWLVCGASEAPAGRWTAADTAGWNQDEARVCVMRPGEELPEFGNGVYLGYNYFKSFPGDKYMMSCGAVEFTPRV